MSTRISKSGKLCNDCKEVVHTISTYEELMDKGFEYHAGHRPTAQAVACAMLNSFYSDEILKGRLQINVDLVAVSYIINPTMLKKQIEKRQPYISLSVTVDKEWVTIEYSTRPIYKNFLSRVLAKIEETGQFTSKRDKLPITYRYRPDHLATKIAEALGKQIAINAKRETSITWRVLDK